MIYTEEQLNALIQDVEKEFGAAMAKAEAPLAAAKEDPKPEDKKKSGPET